MLSFKKSITAIAVAASLGVAIPAMAAGNNDGSLTGSIHNREMKTITGATVTIKNEQTGFERTVEVEADGSYRFGKLPVGRYSLTVSKPGFETVQLEDVSIRIGSNSANIPLVEAGYEKIEVTGAQISMMDVTSSETALNIGEVELDRIPVPRNVTSVALLAPGTTSGDGRFGPAGTNGFASFGGASIAENAMYINGLNVTNFRNGLGFSSVPFEFYKEFQVKTGGYSAEFGRSTGGVINAVTKSGTNEFKFGGNFYYQPDSLRDDNPDSMEATGNPYLINNQDSRDNIEGNIYASGPIIEDTLFFYAIYNPKKYESEDVVSRGDGFRKRDQDDSFWGAKIDWRITDDHLLEYLAFSDSNDVVDSNYGYDHETQTLGNLISTATSSTGGDNYSIKYTGYWTDDLTVSALYGENEYSLTTLADNQADCNMVLDVRDAAFGYDIGCATLNDYFVEVGEDTREAMRFDIEYMLGDHVIRAGYDTEINTSMSQQKYSGTGDGGYWVLYDGNPGTSVAPGVVIPDGVTEYARLRVRTVGGEFETEASAMYLEDIWTVSDRLTLQMGVRLETFDNKNSAGETFVKIDDMVAPRFGISYDLTGDGSSKVFANIGRYFLPVANNTNVRLSGNESDVRTFYALNGLTEGEYNGNTFYTPDVGASFGETINAAGVVPDTTVIVDQDLDPMYQDEVIIGYQSLIDDSWAWGVTASTRKLNGAIDDMLIDHYTEEKYGCGHVDHNYVLGNPGQDMDVNVDTDCDGVGDGVITIPGADLGYPEAVRKYHSVVLTLDRQWDDVWMMSASYTWSHSYGNTEGLVKSDNGQDDAGITTDFDFVELTDGAYGNLANDRRHMFKVFGAYSLTENLTLSANLRIESGRPRNAFGIGYPGQGELSYGQTYYVCSANCDDAGNEVFTFMPRGSFGSTDWTNRLDLGASYSMEVGNFDVQFRADVFNVLGGDGVTYYNEDVELGLGDQDPIFGLPQQWQTPRYVQFSVSVDY